MHVGQADVIAALKEHGEMTSKEVAGHLPSIPLGTVLSNLSGARRSGLVEMRKIDRKSGGVDFVPKTEIDDKR